MKNRIDFIDIARGFAITFIVFGHTITYAQHCEIIYKILCSFHVVLFFILSGYTFKIKEESFYTFSKRKFSRIMIPYFIWSIIFIVPYIIFGPKVASNVGAKASFDIPQQLFKVLYGNGNEQALKQNTALWFLPALFSMEMIYYWIIKGIKNKTKFVKIFTLIPILIIAYIVNFYMKFTLPWGINTVLVLGIFFYIGYLLKELEMFTKDKLFKIYYMINIFFIGIITGLMNQKISAVNYRYGNLTLCIISGICLSLIVIYISYLINENKVIEYIGKNTMHILIFHKLPIVVFQTKLGVVSNTLKDSNWIIEMIICIFVVSIAVGCSLIIAKCLGKTNELIKKVKKK